jgi:quinol-cytochrome oxidoreductase complex cytochrome b subunit
MGFWRTLCLQSNIEEVLSFHFQFPFLLCGFRILHLFYLHFLSSNNPLRNSINNKIPFFPFIFHKDFFGFILILCLYLLQTHFGISSFSHPDICPDNAVRFNVMPRRIPDFPDSFHSWNFLSSIGSGRTFRSFAIFLCVEILYILFGFDLARVHVLWHPRFSIVCPVPAFIHIR